MTEELALVPYGGSTLAPQSEEIKPSALLPFFQTGHVTKLIIRYDGYGDDGTVDLSEWEGKDDFNPDDYQTPSGLTLRYAIEEAVSQMLPGGWEIDEGSAGTVTITCENDRIKVSVEHGWRETVYNYEEYEF